MGKPIPVIFVGHAIGEEKVVKAIKSGAADYILKTNPIAIGLKNLSTAIKEVLNQHPVHGIANKIVETATEAILTLSAEGLIKTVNPAVTAIFGYLPEEVVNKSLGFLIPKFENEKQLNLYLSPPANQAIGKTAEELFGKHKSGTNFHIAINLSHIDECNEKYNIVYISDLTEIREKQISQQSLLLKTHEMTRTGTWQFDVQTGNVVWDALLYEIFEADADFKPTYEKYINQISEVHREKAVNAIQSAMGSKSSFSSQYDIFTFKNNTRHIQSWGEVILGSDGGLLGMIGVCMDITERKVLERELKTFNDISATVGGKDYFKTIVNLLCTHLDIKFALIGEYFSGKKVRTLGYSINGEIQNNYIKGNIFLFKDGNLL